MAEIMADGIEANMALRNVAADDVRRGREMMDRVKKSLSKRAIITWGCKIYRFNPHE